MKNTISKRKIKFCWIACKSFNGVNKISSSPRSCGYSNIFDVTYLSSLYSHKDCLSSKWFGLERNPSTISVGIVDSSNFPCRRSNINNCKSCSCKKRSEEHTSELQSRG